MASGKMKKENIITITVVAFAVLLSLIVVLVKTGVIGKPAETTTEPREGIDYEVVTTKVTKSGVDDEGNVFYYEVDETYTRPLHSSNHRYPTTTTTTKPTTEDEDVTYFIEEESVVNVTDENGEQVTNENGEPVTKIEKVTIITDKDGKTTTSKDDTTTETTTQTTSERTTKVIYVTDPISKKPIKNIRGEYIVSGVETEPETTTTTKPSTTKPTTTTKKPSSTAATEDTTSSTTAPKTSEN